MARMWSSAPESMGYTSVAGVPAEIGLHAAPLALVKYAMFGGSRLMAFATAGLAKLGWITNSASKAMMSGFIVGLSIQIIVGRFGKLFGIDQSGRQHVLQVVVGDHRRGDHYRARRGRGAATGG